MLEASDIKLCFSHSLDGYTICFAQLNLGTFKGIALRFFIFFTPGTWLPQYPVPHFCEKIAADRKSQ